MADTIKGVVWVPYQHLAVEPAAERGSYSVGNRNLYAAAGSPVRR